MCKERASFTVDHDGVEEVCGGHEVPLIGLLTRPGLDHGWSCKQVTSSLRS